MIVIENFAIEIRMVMLWKVHIVMVSEVFQQKCYLCTYTSKPLYIFEHTYILPSIHLALTALTPFSIHSKDSQTQNKNA